MYLPFYSSYGSRTLLNTAINVPLTLAASAIHMHDTNKYRERKKPVRSRLSCEAYKIYESLEIESSSRRLLLTKMKPSLIPYEV